MPEVTVTIHKHGLHPMEAFKAHHKSQELGMSLDEIITEGEVHNLSGNIPGRYALWAAIKRIRDMGQDELPIVAAKQRWSWRRANQILCFVCAEVATQAVLHLPLH